MAEFDEPWLSSTVVHAPKIDSSESFDVSVVLSTGRGAETAFSWSVAGGTLTASEGVMKDAALTITVAPKDAQEILAGTLPVAAAFMQGRLKPAGDNALWLRLAKASTSSEFTKWLAAIR